MRECLFIWVPKCAGTSIFSVLEEHGCRKLKAPVQFKSFDNQGSVTFGHVGVPALLSGGHISQEYFDRAFKFAFVRNPWDRLVSLWSYLSQAGIPRKDISFNEFVNCAAAVPPVGPYNRKGLSQARPMCAWLFDKDGNSLTDFVGQVERPEDFLALGEYLGIEDEFPVVNTSKHGKYREYYTPATRQVVADLYENDIRRFGYEF